MIVAVPREVVPGERRVALVPETVARFVEQGITVRIQSGAGEASGVLDESYRQAGATLMDSAAPLLDGADVVLKVQRPLPEELDLLPLDSTLIALFHPLSHPELVGQFARRRITAFSMDLVPRITRAQKMDALSSQSTASGYRAVLVAAERLPRFLPMLMTAAGTIPPAKVLVLGAGVAGLQAIATARRLGAMVQAFDIRPAAKEQVESLGATYVGLTLDTAEDKGGYAKEVSDDVHRREQEHLLGLVREADAVISTALVPGRRAPVLISEEMVRAMKPGSVIVDIAAESGGNCVLTEPDTDVVRHGVTIVGMTGSGGAVPVHSSQMYSRNIAGLLLHLIKDGALDVNLDDEIVRGCLVTHGGEVLHSGARALVEAGA